MKKSIVDRATQLFNEGKIQGFLGLREQNGLIAPYLFTRPEELSELSLGDVDSAGDARYPIAKVLLDVAGAYPEAILGVMLRGCEERSLIELFKWNQLKEDHVVRVGMACPADLAQRCQCLKPYPENPVAGEIVPGVEAQATVAAVDAIPVEERFQYWLGEFDKCVKCYGCRNICPVCFCKEWTLEETELIETGHLPVENPIFHLTRAVHMIGRCIDCGLCEEACPADIPLRTLYKKVAALVAEQTGYRPGMSTDEKCPFNLFSAPGA